MIRKGKINMQRLVLVVGLTWMIIRPYPSQVTVNIVTLTTLIPFIFLLWYNRLTIPTLIKKNRNLVLAFSIIMISQMISITYSYIFIGTSINIRDLFELARMPFFLIILIGTLSSMSDDNMYTIEKTFSNASLFAIGIGFMQLIKFPALQSVMEALYYQSSRITFIVSRQNRIVSSFMNPNFFGAFFIFFLSWSLINFLTHYDKQKYKYGFYIILSEVGVILSTSRTSIITSLVLTGIVVILFVLKSKEGLNIGFSRKTLIVSSVMIVSCFIVLIFLLKDRVPYVENAVDIITNSKGNFALVNSVSLRINIWLSSVADIMKSPILGYGPAKSMRSFVDNNYLFIVFRYGILGLLSYLYLYGSILVSLYRGITRETSMLLKRVRIMLIAILLSFSFMALMMEIFESMQLMSIYFFFYAIHLTGTERRSKNANNLSNLNIQSKA
ncbi:MAG: O-antigen ligase family protein [Firmicutes bacterium]|nr:O-antigen ligase family protein [Bacillota bacterium]